MAIDTVIDSIFNIFSTIKKVAWEMLKLPFIWWFGLPGYVRICVAVILVIFASLILYLFYKNISEWRRRYIF